mmetsp:Transcript_55316/g.135463  ORF Transcript_55316/g.135463 Transcript_55316/m.135463 type:complete len:210 (-) Transcript_55316:141-770(-)
MILAMISSTSAFSLMNSAYAAAFASSCSFICSLSTALAATACTRRAACFSSSARTSLILRASSCRSAIAIRSRSCSSMVAFSASCFRRSWFMYAARSFCSSSRSSGASLRTFSMIFSSRTRSFLRFSSSAARRSSRSARARCCWICAACWMRSSIARSCACSAARRARRLFATRSSDPALPSSILSRAICAWKSARRTSSAKVCCIFNS